MEKSENLVMRVVSDVCELFYFFVSIAGGAVWKGLVIDHDIVKIDLSLSVDSDHSEVGIIENLNEGVVLFELRFEIARIVAHWLYSNEQWNPSPINYNSVLKIKPSINQFNHIFRAHWTLYFRQFIKTSSTWLSTFKYYR